MVLRLRPEARLDLEAAVRWYEAQENGLGRMFVQEVRQQGSLEVMQSSAPELVLASPAAPVTP